MGVAMTHSFHTSRRRGDRGAGPGRRHRADARLGRVPTWERRSTRRIIEAQMSGGLLFGLSAAMMEGDQFCRWRGAGQWNFPDHDALRLHQTPAVEVRILWRRKSHLRRRGRACDAARDAGTGQRDLRPDRAHASATCPLNRRVRFVA